MQGYNDEYEDLDEYEEDDEAQVKEAGEDEYEEEEPRQPTQEELDYLELRQQLKESIRKQRKKESGSAFSNSREKKSKLPYDNYGSFFGPSQPVIAQRVIQESKSLLENPHLAARVSKANSGKNKRFTSTPTVSKPRVNNRPTGVKSQLTSKTKIQMLKNTRDYSFLLSDDAELPALTRDPPRSGATPKSDAHLVPRTLPNASRKTPTDREERKPRPSSSSVPTKSGPQKPAPTIKLNVAYVDSRKQNGSSNGSGPGRPLGPKGIPSKNPMITKQKVLASPVVKSSVSAVQKSIPSKLLQSVSKKPLVKREHMEPRGKVIAKSSAISSKSQIEQQPRKKSSHVPLREERPKKRTVRPHSDDEDDDGRAISMIRSMFRYNPNRYRDDDDDSDMEANFEDIMMEERRSAKIAKKEDDEELQKIEEEERRERMRRDAKKRKLVR